MSRAAADVLAIEISSSPTTYAIPTGARRDAPLIRATHVFHGRFAKTAGRLRLDASIERLDSNRMERSLNAEGPVGSGILPLLRSIARQIEPSGRPFGTANQQALQAYGEAGFERAVAVDPNFGGAYASWAQFLLFRGDRDGAGRVLEMAGPRSSGFTELDRVRLALLAATLRNDNAAKIEALRALSRLAPADADVLRNLAAAETLAHEYAAALDSFRKAIARDPANELLWNDLGYAHAFAGDMDAAREALLEYRRLAPDQANPLDSLGDVHFHWGHFGEAEKFYLEAHRKNSAFLGGGALYKAARARLMTGDVAGADRLFRRFLELRRAGNDALAPYREAQWNYLAGRRKEATAQLSAFASGAVPPEAASQAWSQLSVWSLIVGDREQARAYSGRAARTAQSPLSQVYASMTRYLAEPAASPGELAARAERTFPSDRGSGKQALAYALLLGGHFEEAVPVLTELSQEVSPTSPNQVNVLLAWALIKQRRIAEAEKFLDVYGFPPSGGEYIFSCLTFPGIFQLRSEVLELQGKREEAAAAMELFRKLSGGEADQSRPSTRS